MDAGEEYLNDAEEAYAALRASKTRADTAEAGRQAEKARADAQEPWPGNTGSLGSIPTGPTDPSIALGRACPARADGRAHAGGVTAAWLATNHRVAQPTGDDRAARPAA